MGGKAVFRNPIRSIHDLEAAIEKGLPKMALRRVGSFISPKKNKFIYKVVPEGTYKRRKSALSLEESEKTERIARIIATALHVWGDTEKARTFLNTPHPFFHERPPIEVGLTELGARQVEELL